MILVVSLDPEFYLIARHLLEQEGFDVRLAASAEETIQLGKETLAAAVILDCRSDTFDVTTEICSRLKGSIDTVGIRTIAVIGNGARGDHFELLKAGADDIMRRPFAPAKLLDILHEESGEEPEGTAADRTASLHYADLEMDVSSHRIRRGASLVRLPTIEFNILKILMGNPEHVFSRQDLINGAWPPRVYVEPRTVDVHVGHLRRLLMQKGGSDVIRTVRAAGYSLDINPHEGGS